MKNEILSLLQSKSYINQEELKQIAALIQGKPEIIADLIPFLYQENYRIMQKVGLILSDLAGRSPKLFLPYISPLLDNLYKTKDDATKRNTLRILQYVDIPKTQHDAAVDLCFRYLENRQEAVAIQVFAMTVLAHLIDEYTELKNELILILEDRIPNSSAGYRSRAKKVLKTLS